MENDTDEKVIKSLKGVFLPWRLSFTAIRFCSPARTHQ